MDNEKGRELYYSLEVIQTIRRVEAHYIYKETGLTLGTLYNESDFNYYRDVSKEILPEKLAHFLALLIWKLPALEEVYSSDYEERLLKYFEEIIEEDGGEM